MNYKVIISIFLLNFFVAQIYATDDKKKQLEILRVLQDKRYEKIIKFNNCLNERMRQNPLNRIDYERALKWRRAMLFNNRSLCQQIRNLERVIRDEAAQILLGLKDSKSGNKRKREELH